ncbi:MAG TPA: hypothetical protein VES40_04935 [Ilumatobacteraceae bacterium]|nr:hypothetical protein [Ilumatobacteraceae bacterium]
MNQAKHRARRSFSRAEGAASGVERDGDRSEQITYAGGETLDNSTRNASRRPKPRTRYSMALLSGFCLFGGVCRSDTTRGIAGLAWRLPLIQLGTRPDRASWLSRRLIV